MSLTRFGEMDYGRISQIHMLMANASNSLQNNMYNDIKLRVTTAEGTSAFYHAGQCETG